MSIYVPGFDGDILVATNVDFSLPIGNATKNITSLGQILMGSGNVNPLPEIVPATLVAGAGITITPALGAPNTLTFSSTAAGVIFNLIAVNTAGVTNNGYVCSAAANLLVSLPLVSAFGDLFIVERNLNVAGQWTITQAAGQQILAGNASTTVGVAGSLGSTNLGDVVVLRCVVPNLTWSTESITGNLNAL